MVKVRKTLSRENVQALRELLRFSIPIIIGQIGIMLINTGDMIIAGRFSRECLAAIGLAIAIANPIQISLLGMQFSISPLLAQKRGHGESIAPYFWTVILYSFLISIVSGGLTLVSIFLVPLLGYTDNLNTLIIDYLIITSFSSIGLCLYQGVKEFFQSEEKTFAANLVAILGALLNLAFNYIFVFGKFGMPALNEMGLAWASLFIRFVMGGLLCLVAWNWWKNPIKINWNFMKELGSVGGPISISLFFEILAFCSVTLFVGKFAEVQTAANNLALNIGSLAFMFPLSIAAAVSVKVGHAYGKRSLSGVKTYSLVGLISSFVFTCLIGCLFFTLPDQILRVYTEDQEVLIWGKKLLFWIACFQLFDGVQVTLAGALRGLSITRETTFCIFIGYWIIGIPLGYYLGFQRGFEAQGFWIGLAISLGVVAALLAFIFRNKMIFFKKELRS